MTLLETTEWVGPDVLLWGERPEEYEDRPQLVVHHSATAYNVLPCDEARELAWVRAVDRWHHDKRGFTYGFAYHLCVFPCGHGYQLRRLDRWGTHISQLNHKYVGLVFPGAFGPGEQPTPEALTKAAQIIDEGDLELAGGHGDVALPGYGTPCPGAWDELKVLGGYLKALTDPDAPGAEYAEEVARSLDRIEDAVRAERTHLGVRRGRLDQ